ncbi:MAG: DUF5672 family protein [Candidatus Gastranaerophilaceae bacterium]
MTEKVAVVIPIYSKYPTKDEKSSLIQCKKILGEHPTIVVCPQSLDVSEYKFLTNRFERFEDKNFKSVKSYSRLCLDVNFYKRFEDFEYILIYQPDGWVFKDELKKWCKQGYDYIGAPWFEGFEKADEKSKMLKEVGNGGMSLRNVKKHIKLFEKPFFIQSYSAIAEENRKHKIISNLLNIPVNICKYLSQYIIPSRYGTKLNEDFYIAKYAKKIVPDFNFPTAETASKFAFENQPQRLYEMNGNNLPFLCHAFKKYDYEFWKNFIKLNEEPTLG